MTSVTGALAEDSSTMALLVANAATRAWTARLLTARGTPRLDLVDQGDRVVREQRVRAAGQFEVMGQLALGLGLAHTGHRETQRDPLVQCGERTKLDPPAQDGLAHEQAGEW